MTSRSRLQAKRIDGWLLEPLLQCKEVEMMGIGDWSGVWRSYSWAESRALEAGASGGEEEVCLTTLGRSYTVDLTAMQQLNDHTGTARPVQRVAPAPLTADAANSNAAPGNIFIQGFPSWDNQLFISYIFIYGLQHPLLLLSGRISCCLSLSPLILSLCYSHSLLAMC